MATAAPAAIMAGSSLLQGLGSFVSAKQQQELTREQLAFIEDQFFGQRALQTDTTNPLLLGAAQAAGGNAQQLLSDPLGSALGQFGQQALQQQSTLQGATLQPILQSLSGGGPEQQTLETLAPTLQSLIDLQPFQPQDSLQPTQAFQQLSTGQLPGLEGFQDRAAGGGFSELQNPFSQLGTQNPALAIIAAQEPIFQRQLQQAQASLANRAPSTAGTAFHEQGIDLTSRALQDFNLFGAQALQQGQALQLQQQQAALNFMLGSRGLQQEAQQVGGAQALQAAGLQQQGILNTAQIAAQARQAQDQLMLQSLGLETDQALGGSQVLGQLAQAAGDAPFARLLQAAQLGTEQTGQQQQAASQLVTNPLAQLLLGSQQFAQPSDLQTIIGPSFLFDRTGEPSRTAVQAAIQAAIQQPGTTPFNIGQRIQEAIAGLQATTPGSNIQLPGSPTGATPTFPGGAPPASGKPGHTPPPGFNIPGTTPPGTGTPPAQSIGGIPAGQFTPAFTSAIQQRSASGQPVLVQRGRDIFYLNPQTNQFHYVDEPFFRQNFGDNFDQTIRISEADNALVEANLGQPLRGTSSSGPPGPGPTAPAAQPTAPNPPPRRDGIIRPEGARSFSLGQVPAQGQNFQFQPQRSGLPSYIMGPINQRFQQGEPVLVSPIGDERVFQVFPDGSFKHIPNPQTFEQAFGSLSEAFRSGQIMQLTPSQWDRLI